MSEPLKGIGIHFTSVVWYSTLLVWYSTSSLWFLDQVSDSHQGFFRVYFPIILHSFLSCVEANIQNNK